MVNFITNFPFPSSRTTFNGNIIRLFISRQWRIMVELSLIHLPIHVPNSVAVIPPSAARARLESGTSPVLRALETSGWTGTKEEPWLVGCSPGRRGRRLTPDAGRPDGAGWRQKPPRTRGGPCPSIRGPSIGGACSASILVAGAGSGVWEFPPSPVPEPHAEAGSGISLGRMAQHSEGC